jgi:hypothetical protein
MPHRQLVWISGAQFQGIASHGWWCRVTENLDQFHYEVEPLSVARCARVVAGKGREFLVLTLSGPPAKTAIFMWSEFARCVIQVHEAAGDVDPEAAVSGYLLMSPRNKNPIDELRRQLEIQRAAYWRLQNERSRAERSGAKSRR